MMHFRFELALYYPVNSGGSFFPGNLLNEIKG